jgi:vacuolar iron transporter family protein
MKSFDAKYLKAAVYGANDGIITTFAVVAGIAGAKLAVHIVLILGIANMVADGISMAAGDYLGERSEQRLLKRRRERHSEKGIWKTGFVTFIAFVTAGILPLMPYILAFLGIPISIEKQFMYSILSTCAALFFVGSMRTFLTKGSWIKNGLEMLIVGAVAATIAYVVGALIERALL